MEKLKIKSEKFAYKSLIIDIIKKENIKCLVEELIINLSNKASQIEKSYFIEENNRYYLINGNGYYLFIVLIQETLFIDLLYQEGMVDINMMLSCLKKNIKEEDIYCTHIFRKCVPFEYRVTSQVENWILDFLEKNEAVKFWDLLKFSDYPFYETAKKVKELEKKGTINIENQLVKLKLHKDKFKNVFKTCPSCDDQFIWRSEDWYKIKREWVIIKKSRPLNNENFNQTYVNDDTILNRSMLILKRSILKDLKVLILGDDDLTSIALSLLYPNLSIDVLEIDSRIVRFINEVSKENKLKIKAYEYDAREPLPKNFKGKYTTFFTDPAPTSECVYLFLSRLIEGLQIKRGLRVFTSISANRQKNEYDIRYQEIFSSFGLLISFIIPHFTSYYYNGSLDEHDISSFLERFASQDTVSFTEKMFELTTTNKTFPVIKDTYINSLDILFGK